MNTTGFFVGVVTDDISAETAVTKHISGPAGARVLLLGSFLVLAAALPAVAQPAVPAVAQSTTPGNGIVQTGHSETGEGDHEAFRARVKNELAEWGGKMRGFNERIKASGQQHADAAESRVRAAWSDTEAEGRKVQAATAREWEGVKESYEAASHDLAVAWDKIRH